MEIEKMDLNDFGSLFKKNPSELNEQELLSVDLILHKAWKLKTEGGRVHLGEKSYSNEDIINLHALVLGEFTKRGVKHTLDDELYKQTLPFMKSQNDLAPVYPSGVELGREITLEEILPQIKTFYIHPVFAWLVGGLANWGKTKGDIDILWWANEEIPDYLKKIIEFRFGRQFKDAELSKRIHHHLNYFQGPFTKAIPIYALKAERINPEGEIKEAAINPKPVELVWSSKYNGWTLPDDIVKQTDIFTQQAEQSAKEDKVELFRFFYALKPAKAHKPDEPQTIDAFIKVFKSDDYPVYSSKKFDGANHIIFRDYDKVQILSEDGTDNTSRFPYIIEAIKKLEVTRFAVLAEIEQWENDRHMPRETVAAYLNNSDEPDDSNLIANIYDIVFFESETVKPGDIHKLPFIERLKFLKALNIPQSTDSIPDLKLKLNMVPHEPANNPKELREQTERLRCLEGSEGNVAKPHNFIYNLENKPSGMAKFHNSAVLRAIVTDLKETKTPQVYTYFYGLEVDDEFEVPDDTLKKINGKKYHEIGTTFSTSIKANVGDVLDVEIENLNLTDNLIDETTSITAWVPRVLGISKEKAMSITEAIKTARANYILQEKEINEDGEIIYKGIRQAFGSYGGKRFFAHRIASYIPHHRTYVEPFAGGAAVFFAKDPSPKEVLNDYDPEIAFMYKFIRDHTIEDRNALLKRDWTMRREIFDRLKNLEPQNDRERFYKAFYLTRASYGKKRGESYDVSHEGRKIDFLNTISTAQKRLHKVKITNKNYLDVLKEYDSEDTFFYMDPPYPGKYNFFDKGFKHEEFLKAVKKLKAKWLISYPVEKADDFKEYHVYKVKRPNHMKGKGGNQEWVTEIMVSNFPLKPLNLYIEKDINSKLEELMSDTHEFLPQLNDEFSKIQAAFKSPGGKFRLFKKIIKFIPEHKRYVEAFCGGAQVLFHKKPSGEEIINDINPDLIFAYRFIKNMSDDDYKWLKEQNWVITRKRARKVFESKPRTPRERFYKFAYLNKATYWGRSDVWESTRNKDEGLEIKLIERLPEIKERLKNVKILNKDWKEVINEYDSKDTLFYLDPPYPKHWPMQPKSSGPKFFKEEEMLSVLKSIKGKFILSYELEKLPLFKGFKTYRVKTLWTGARQLGTRSKYELLVSNFPLSEENLYFEKSFEVKKQDELYDFNPPEDVSYQYVIQSHWRGMSEHKDFRLESINKEFLIGWTLADLIDGVVKEPVESLEDAKRWSNDGSYSKIDFKTGSFKERQTRSGNIVPAQLRAFPKAREPHAWLEVEGVTEPFPAPGATKQYRGVFLIEDKGIVEYGAQKPDVHEYFLNGKLKGRLIIRRLVREDLQGKTKILPPGKLDESPIINTTMWVAIKPLEQTPLVLTDREVENKWFPPFGISALPKSIRKLIPDKYQYWKIEDRSQALQVRNMLVDAIKKGEIKIDFEKQVTAKVPFVLQYQYFRGPVLVREGPSKEIWTLRIAMSPTRVLAFQLSNNPQKTGQLSATLNIEDTAKYMDVEGEIKPQTYLNPTKETPSYISIIDKGETIVLIDGEMFKKFEFKGEKMHGIWICEKTREETLWNIKLEQ